MATETVKGFADYSGEEAAKRQRIKGILAGIFKLYGFELSETPMIEYEEFVKGDNENDDVISDVFKLEDKGKRKLALRYEFTFQLKRLACNKKLPYKRYQIGEVFRDEPTSGIRFKQFTQCDVDTIGSSVKEEAEILKIASEILRSLGIKAGININNRKLINEILEEQKIKEQDRLKVIKEIDKLDKLSEKEVRGNLGKYKAGGLIEIFKKPEKYFAKYKAYREIKELKDFCSIYGVKVNFQPSLARGLSYYNGSVFEIKTKNMKESICGGGSFMVNGVQSTGMSFGVERLNQLADVRVENKRILIISIGKDKGAMKLAEKLRKENLACLIMFGKISKSLDYADSYKIPYVIFVGEEEVKKKKFKLRDMKSGKEEMLDEKEIIEKLRK